MSLKDDCRGRWPSILLALGVDKKILSGKHQACPLCRAGKDRFRFSDYEGDGNYYCEQCSPGNGMTLLMGIKGWDWDRAINEVRKVVGRDLPPVSCEIRMETADIQKIHNFGAGLQKIQEGDVVAQYLAGRGLPVSQHLRIHPGHPLYNNTDFIGTFPVMVGLFQDENGTPTGYHRTYITPDGKYRKVMGKGIAGSAVRLSPVAPVIGLAEGIETAMSVTVLLGKPCWAAYSKNNLRSFVPPAGVEKVVIYADSDPDFGGQLAAVKAARDLVGRGVKVELAPFLARGDYNDLLKEKMRYGIAS